MSLPLGDAQLVQIMDAALDHAAEKAGSRLACRPGCTQCCHGAFAINALDTARLRAGLAALYQADPAIAESIQQRARDWIAGYCTDFPGDTSTGILGPSEEEQACFEDFANDAPCPALNPSTGMCDVYAWRPMTCRVFGPPIRMHEGEALGCCELCFVGATDEQIAACEMPIPHHIEARLLDQMGNAAETVVAFALLP